MKFSWKIFFITFLIIITSFGVGGFLLINTVFTNTLNNRIDSAKKNNNYITTALSVYADPRFLYHPYTVHSIPFRKSFHGKGQCFCCVQKAEVFRIPLM